MNEETIDVDKILVTDPSHDVQIPQAKPVPSLSFTVGYLNAKANWRAISALQAFCLNKSRAEPEVFVKYLRASDLDLTVSELSHIASQAGWPSPGTLKALNTINNSEWLGNAVQLIFAKSTEDSRNEKLESLVDAIEKLTKDVFIDANHAKADLGMVLLGNQIGKIDALIALGMQAGDPELEKMVPAFRSWIKAVFLAQTAPGNKLHEQISWIIADNPSLTAKVDSMTSSELAVFVGRAKDAYLTFSK